MVGIGPFISHGSTPLKDAASGDVQLALKVMALTRILLKDINIPATTAVETLLPNGRMIALRSGANVVMPNIGLSTYKKLFDIYPGKVCVNEDFSKCRNCIESQILAIGRTVSRTKGSHKKSTR